jgi:hypothetical protein
MLRKEIKNQISQRKPMKNMENIQQKILELKKIYLKKIINKNY